tara:strand:+ start:112 stop:600 length:489 start_codon:yes stop_codon:yes gene_type:complete
MLPIDIRIGHGYDIHQLVDSLPLIVCGIKIDSPKGSLGHSDGDVGIHAICDAILGALALGDLGTHFPSSDPKWAGQESSTFLTHILKLMDNEGYGINNIDCTIILQSPKLNTYIQSMRKMIAHICNIDINMVSIKATTTDKLGSIGNGEGIGSSSIVLLDKR